MADDRFNHHQGASASRWGPKLKDGSCYPGQGPGRSRGGLGTKIHAAAALANPARLIGGPGQQYDITRAEDLINGSKAGAVIADKGYDANKLEAKIAEQGSELVIPPKRKCKSPRAYNKDLYPITKISIRTAI